MNDKRSITRYIFDILCDGMGDTIELIVVCFILSGFRFVFTGKTIFNQPGCVKAALILIALSTIFNTYMKSSESKLGLDLIFNICFRIIRTAFSIATVATVIIM